MRPILHAASVEGLEDKMDKFIDDGVNIAARRIFRELEGVGETLETDDETAAELREDEEKGFGDKLPQFLDFVKIDADGGLDKVRKNKVLKGGWLRRMYYLLALSFVIMNVYMLTFTDL